jgi:hypothetical protein
MDWYVQQSRLGLYTRGVRWDTDSLSPPPFRTHAFNHTNPKRGCMKLNCLSACQCCCHCRSLLPLQMRCCLSLCLSVRAMRLLTVHGLHDCVIMRPDTPAHAAAVCCLLLLPPFPHLCAAA